MADEPMSDEQLAEIRQFNMLRVGDAETFRTIHMLLAEVRRLRAREAAALAITERMAEGVPIGSPARCYYCDAVYDFEDRPSGVHLLEAPHKPDCPVAQAQVYRDGNERTA